MDEALALNLDHWEGPLDLLLSLARAQKVDLRRISILQLVEQYLAVIAEAGALRLGIARALTLVGPENRAALKRAGFLTRDARIKERKKYGLKKARKAPQYSKR